MKEKQLIYLSSYVPRKCGIATYTNDLLLSISKRGRNVGQSVLAFDDIQGILKYPAEVVKKIKFGSLKHYVKSAKYINKQKNSIIMLQHEFGLYAGDDGRSILDLIKLIKKPIFTTFHTVLSNPTKNKIEIIKQLSNQSSNVIVMANSAAKILQEKYGIEKEKIKTIPHGVPDISSNLGEKQDIKKILGLGNREIVSTFGLINPNKGIEYGIEAVALLRKTFPKILFIIIGRTHPIIRRNQSENYRNSLIKMVADQNLGKHVKFINRYLNINELILFLKATDIYITPYIEPEQITSGALSYAMGAGKVCISSPYAYAKEVLADGRGIIVPFKDSFALAASIDYVLKSKPLQDNISEKVYNYSRKMVWDKVAESHLNLINQNE